MSHALPSHALPSHALPSHALPCRALLLISEYSKPLTRPDWRQSKPIITTYRLYLVVINNYSDLSYSVLTNIWFTDWYILYSYIKNYGIENYYDNNINHNILHIDGINHLLNDAK
jgi:hypothetical protein